MLPRLYHFNQWVIDLDRLELVKGIEETKENSRPYTYDFIYCGKSYTSRHSNEKSAQEARDALIKAWGGSEESLEDGIL